MSRTAPDAVGARVGFQGQSYATVKGRLTQYDDEFADYWEFLQPKLEQAWRLLNPTPAPCTCAWTTARATTPR